jgi:hypothetical protein
MKDPGTLRGRKDLARERATRRTRSHQTPVRANTKAPAELTLCDGCGAVFEHKTWRKSPGRRDRALEQGGAWARCPACERTASTPAGTVVLTGELVDAMEGELRRRVQNVCERAMFTQPERRLLALERGPAWLKVTMTSQELAHRVGREIEKAFGGRTSYSWSDTDGHLLARWQSPVAPGSPARR